MLLTIGTENLLFYNALDMGGGVSMALTGLFSWEFLFYTLLAGN